jgi:hypothetical protein
MAEENRFKTDIRNAAKINAELANNNWKPILMAAIEGPNRETLCHSRKNFLKG